MVDEMVKEDLRIAMKDKLVDDAGLRRNLNSISRERERPKRRCHKRIIEYSDVA